MKIARLALVDESAYLIAFYCCNIINEVIYQYLVIY